MPSQSQTSRILRRSPSAIIIAHSQPVLRGTVQRPSRGRAASAAIDRPVLEVPDGRRE